MKWLICLLLALAVVWLGWPRNGEREGENEVVESRRPNRDRDKRAESKGFSELRKLESFAEDLSDEELWQELELTCRTWLESEGAGKWSRPPDVVAILAREIGARDGLEGMVALTDFLEGLDGEGPVGVTDPRLKLSLVLPYGAFGGWSSNQASEALSWVVEEDFKEPEVAKYFRGLNAEFDDEVISLAGQRVLRSAFERLVRSDPDAAGRLLSRGMKTGRFDPNSMLGTVLPFLDPGQREVLLARVPDSSYEVLWEPSTELASGRLTTELLMKYSEVVARTHPEKAAELLGDSSLDFTGRKRLFGYYAYYDPAAMSLIPMFTPKEQMKVLRTMTSDPSLASFGPIDGRSGGLLSDLEEVYQGVQRAIDRSDLVDSQKAELRERLQKSRE